MYPVSNSNRIVSPLIFEIAGKLPVASIAKKNIFLAIITLAILSLSVSASDFISANFKDDSISIYEDSTRYDIKVGDGPNKVEIINGLALVTNTIDNTVSVVDIEKKEINRKKGKKIIIKKRSKGKTLASTKGN